MTPYEQVRKAFEFPFELRNYQQDNTNLLMNHSRSGFWWEAGSGKTAGSTHWMLYQSLQDQAEQWVLLMPPILLTQWANWLGKVKHAGTNESVTVSIYKGTPKQRKQVDLSADFIVMSYTIFKNDYNDLADHFAGRKVGLLCDEAHAVKNIESQNHKAVRHFAEDRPLGLLTGTPLTKPGDAYAYIKLLTPWVYRNLRQFEKIHVAARDDYEKVTEWANLDLLQQNLHLQATRVIRREVQSELPPITYTPILYDLEPAHAKLYKRIAEERLVELNDGREIDAISTQALYSALQQIVINWGEFADDPDLHPAGLDLVDEIMEELGETGKLVVVANFIRSNRYLLGALGMKYGATAVYGEVSASQKQKAISKFIEDPHCRIILVQPQSAGFGVDGLQHVCSDMLFLEAPTTAPPFHQTAARLDRDGQTNPVNCRVAIANKTVQVRMFRNLLDNDETINAVQGGYQDLKEAILGN
jgi:SNF2 family DNA or RNA helicase